MRPSELIHCGGKIIYKNVKGPNFVDLIVHHKVHYLKVKLVEPLNRWLLTSYTLNIHVQNRSAHNCHTFPIFTCLSYAWTSSTTCLRSLKNKWDKKLSQGLRVRHEHTVSLGLTAGHGRANASKLPRLTRWSYWHDHLRQNNRQGKQKELRALCAVRHKT